MKRLVVIVAAAALAALGGCMEVQQTATPQKQGKYQGKPDTAPWTNAPLAYGDAKWSKGDQAGWENQIKQRNVVQNEYKRIYQ
ncbi:MAG: hypothetical protein OEW21_17610 [Betaproteobacteria bacterium]|nr:hypothetical protein [Betaproteobacteria bacterium]